MATTYTDQLVVVHNGSIKKVASDDTISLGGNLTLGGDLTVNGTTTTINSTEVTVEDKAIVVATGSTDGQIAAAGGAGLKVADETNTLATFLYDGVDSWDVSDHLNLADGQEFKINDTSVLSATTLGSTVVGSSLTSVGTIGTGVWQGTAIADTYVANDLTIVGGTVNNSVIGASTAAAGTFTDITGSGNILFSGNNINLSQHDGISKGLQLGGTLVTATAAELNILDGKVFLDEDNFASNLANAIASQQSIKAYVDAQVVGGSVASAQGVLSASNVVIQSTNGSIDLSAPNGVGTTFTGFNPDSNNLAGASSDTLLSGSVMAFSTNDTWALTFAENSTHSYAAGVVTQDVTALTPMQLNATASIQLSTVPGIPVPVRFETAPTSQGVFCYLNNNNPASVGTATTLVPTGSSQSILRLGVVMSTGSDGGLYKILWQPQFIASL